MHCELSLNLEHRKSIIHIVGGGENVIYTSIPMYHGVPVLLDKSESYTLNIFDNKNLFIFLSKFSKIFKEMERTYYSFEITKTNIFQNKRKEVREITDIPIYIETPFQEFRIARVLDISLSGAKIECNQPIPKEQFTIHFQSKEKTKKIPARITWHKPTDTNHYYGVTF